MCLLTLYVDCLVRSSRSFFLILTSPLLSTTLKYSSALPIPINSYRILFCKIKCTVHKVRVSTKQETFSIDNFKILNRTDTVRDSYCGTYPWSCFDSCYCISDISILGDSCTVGLGSEPEFSLVPLDVHFYHSRRCSWWYSFICGTNPHLKYGQVYVD